MSGVAELELRPEMESVGVIGFIRNRNRLPTPTPGRSRRLCPVSGRLFWPNGYRSYEDIEIQTENESSGNCVTLKRYFARELSLSVSLRVSTGGVFLLGRGSTNGN